MGTTFQFAWEIKLIEFLQNNLPKIFIKFLDLISFVGDMYFLVLLVGIVYLCLDKKAGRKVLMNTILSLMLSGMLKNVFQRRRPYFDNKNIKCLKPVDSKHDIYDATYQGFSFPSMHSSNILTISGSLYTYYKKKILLIITFVVSLIVGSSRFILGCHYPSDVIVGYLIGLISIIGFGYLQDKLEDKYFYMIGIGIIVFGSTFCKSTDFYNASGIYLGYVISEIIDKKYINFKNTKNVVKMVFRLLFAISIFLLVSNALKLPFSESVLEANNYLAFFIRMMRYTIATVMGLGITPIVYKYNILKLND